MQHLRLLSAWLILVALWPGCVQSVSVSPPCGCSCSELELLEMLSHTVAAACASSTVAALPQMAAACNLAATFSPELTRSLAANKTTSLLSGNATPVTVVNPDPLDSVYPDFTLQSIQRDVNQDMQTRDHVSPAPPGSRLRRAPASTGSLSCSPSDVLGSLRKHCIVPGCTWSDDGISDFELWNTTDFTLVCVDAAAVTLPSNRTACASLAQPCSVGIQLTTAAYSQRAVDAAAALIGIWQEDALVQLRGQWGEQRFSAVLQHANKLTRLDASSAGVTSLSSDILASLTSLRSLMLDSNGIRGIDASAFSTLTRLEKLSLEGNGLDSLPPQLLQSCRQLAEIKLARNGLVKLGGNLFQGLSELALIDISKNKLTGLPKDIFQGLTQLMELDMRLNKIVDLPVAVFNGLPLITLDLSQNQLIRLTEGVFQGLTKLSTLGLSSNKLAHIGSTVFHNLSTVQGLDLSVNELTCLQDGLFQGLSRLGDLDIHSNKLVDVSAMAFAGVSANLLSLELSRNRLSHLPAGVFQPLRNLTELYLNGNTFEGIDQMTFQGLDALSILDLSETAMTRLPGGVLRSLSRLTTLKFERGTLKYLTATAFEGLAGLTTLSLSENKLSRLPSGIFEGLSKLHDLELDSNELVELGDTTFHGLSSLHSLDISRNRLTRLPANVFQGLSGLVDLFVDHNKLVDLAPTTLQGLSALRQLDFGHNQLVSLPAGLFQGLPSLVRLYVVNNKLGKFDATVFQEHSAVEVLKLSGNPLNRLEEGVFVVPSQLLSLSQLWLESTSVSRLHLQPNSELEYLTVSGNRLLESVLLPPNSSVAMADVTGTALRIGDFPCDLLGYKELVARSMQHLSSLDVLNACMGERRLFLDISDNAENRIHAVQKVLDMQAASFLVGEEATWSLDPSRLPVRRRPIGLILVSSPVQCSIGTVTRAVYTDSSFDDPHDEPLQVFTCSCIPGYHEHSGVCRETIPFVATAGGIVTVVLTTLVAAGLLFLFQKRVSKRLHRARHDLEMQRGLLEYAETEVLALKRAWELEADDVTLVKRIDGDSEGAFGAVWRGDWDGMAVAVKVLRAGLLELDSTLADEFDREADFLMRARHSNVVRFFGAGRMPGGEPFVVLELVSRGSLRGLLRGSHGSQLDDEMKQRLTLDVARGMACIHSLGALHRDLKSGNVLVTENWRGKVADFGSMRKLLAAAGGANNGFRSMTATDGNAAREMTLTAGVGTPLYMALEVLRGDAYGEAADVWAFGVMVWEVVEQRTPDLLAETGEEGTGRGPLLGRLLKLLEAGKRLQLGAAAPAWAQRVVTECTVAEASQRPSFAVLKDRLVATAGEVRETATD